MYLLQTSIKSLAGYTPNALWVYVCCFSCKFNAKTLHAWFTCIKWSLQEALRLKNNNKSPWNLADPGRAQQVALIEAQGKVVVCMWVCVCVCMRELER